MPIKPQRLNRGDTIGIAAPASPPPDPSSIDVCVTHLEKLGFNVRLAPHARSRQGYLAGSDADRAGDLMALFGDRAVKAILCVRGGYGCARLLGLLDYQAIHANPKILVGYSDITSLHCALLEKANLVSFHGPMLHSDFRNGPPTEFTLEGLLRTLTRAEPAGSICRGNPHPPPVALQGGIASGPLIGGNLSLLCTTIGTDHLPRFQGGILFFEDLCEPPYRVDRMLTHLLSARLLDRVAGVAIGINRDCVDPKAVPGGEYRQSLEDVFRDRLTPLGIPVVMGLPFGHVRDNATLPIGVTATLDAPKGDLVITESAVL